MISLADQNAAIGCGQAVAPFFDCEEFQFLINLKISLQKPDPGKLCNVFVDSDIFVALRSGTASV